MHAGWCAVGAPPTLEGARKVIEELEADVVVYTDVGLEPLSVLLAASRLAPLPGRARIVRGRVSR